MTGVYLEKDEMAFMRSRKYFRLPVTTHLTAGERVLIINDGSRAIVEKRKTPRGISTHALFLKQV